MLFAACVPVEDDPDDGSVRATNAPDAASNLSPTAVLYSYDEQRPVGPLHGGQGVSYRENGRGINDYMVETGAKRLDHRAYARRAHDLASIWWYGPGWQQPSFFSVDRYEDIVERPLAEQYRRKAIRVLDAEQRGQGRSAKVEIDQRNRTACSADAECKIRGGKRLTLTRNGTRHQKRLVLVVDARERQVGADRAVCLGLNRLWTKSGEESVGPGPPPVYWECS
jgi:hypothetical protein